MLLTSIARRAALLNALVAALVVGAGPAQAQPLDQALSPAASIVVQLEASLPGLGGLIDYTARTDPEQLMGTPGAYISLAAFTDSQAPGASVTVEVFATAADRTNRIAQLTAIPSAVETDLTSVSAPVLLRLFSVSSAARQAEYQRALDTAVLP
jgi:hypothetical protein